VTFEEWVIRWHGRILTEAALRELRVAVEALQKEEDSDE
jgi:hypothetical protein